MPAKSVRVYKKVFGIGETTEFLQASRQD
jgi:hypothetical protein